MTLAFLRRSLRFVSSLREPGRAARVEGKQVSQARCTQRRLFRFSVMLRFFVNDARQASSERTRSERRTYT